ncbi:MULTISPECIES: hypothetical protein [unclassified Actinomyces]|uniref:hypothetical protein n=1 Tax=unclassified Actinomyces TaxID=2609248 RepID=UPI002017A2C8|nr:MULTISPECIES: hypothetical protein [unclassified Actinomyces]MCL3777063.1 hypothetical protein [Actinomyces sp. AC-20-1]MCL3790283.1 hypothetical protein [Actinomyces sp. 187325]MCL3791284.1 hypothetical protein [Actinomyces sp. 186855]MCL3793787.1 hypothetical protein [Actinomyces sp. 217892]
MTLSRRLLLRLTGAAALAAAGAPALAACSGDSEDPQEAPLPESWQREVMEPLTVPVPAGMSPFVQESGSTDFYWDRCWTSDTSAVPQGDLVLARLWGAGAEDKASAALGLASLMEIVGTDVTTGETQQVRGGSRQPLTSSTGSGAVWTLTGTPSTAVVVLFGPSVDDDMVSAFEAGLALADEPEPQAPAEGWQRRQAAGLWLLVGEDWNDIGQPEERNGAAPWSRAWTDRVEDSRLPGTVMAGDGLAGASLTEAVAGFLKDPGVTALREAAVSAFSNGSLEGQRVDFLWSGAGDYHGCLWLVRDGDVNRAVILLRWDDSDAFEQNRADAEAGLALV